MLRTEALTRNSIDSSTVPDVRLISATISSHEPFLARRAPTKSLAAATWSAQGWGKVMPCCSRIPRLAESRRWMKVVPDFIIPMCSVTTVEKLSSTSGVPNVVA